MLLAEELALVALDPETGSVELDYGRLDYCLVGLLATDLTQRGKVGLAQDRLVVTDAAPVHDDLLDPTLASLGEHAQDDLDGQIMTTATALAGFFGQVSTKVFERLAADGLVTEHKAHFFSRKHWLPSHADRDQIVARIRAVALDGVVDDSASVLLATLASAELMAKVFPDADDRARATAAAREALAKTPLAAEAKAIADAMDAAVIAAVAAGGAAPGIVP